SGGRHVYLRRVLPAGDTRHLPSARQRHKNILSIWRNDHPVGGRETRGAENVRKPNAWMPFLYPTDRLAVQELVHRSIRIGRVREGGHHNTAVREGGDAIGPKGLRRHHASSPGKSRSVLR